MGGSQLGMNLLHREHLAVLRDTVDCHNWGRSAIGISWARDAAKCPIMHRTAPATKNYLAPNVSSAMVEKLF